jgi:hypothetical protein
MQSEDRSDCVTDFGFDEWLAGEGSDAERARVAAHVQSCTRCGLRGELIERERKVFLAKVPTIGANAELARQSRARKSPARKLGAPVWLGLLAVALIGALGSQLGPLALFERPDAPVPANEGERLNGNSQVGFYIKRGSRVERGASGVVAYPGDQLRFTYSSERPAYLAVLGRDERAASVYFPSGESAVRIERGRHVPLDFSLELDEQLGEEQLYVVLCPAQYALSPLVAELEASGQLRAGAGCFVERIALHKEAPR